MSLVVPLVLLLACDGDDVRLPPERGDRPPRDTDAVDTSETDTPADTAPDTAPDTAADTDPDPDTATDTGDAPAACGDGATGGRHEECDGADDAACPGQCNAACQCPSMAPTGELAIHMVDVGQGDGVLVVSPDGFTLLVDAGDESAYPDLRWYLLGIGADTLDHTLVSHQHADHMGGMDRVLWDHPEVGVAYDGGGRAGTASFEDYVDAAGVRRATVRAGDTIDLGPSVTVDVLHADIGDTENENNNSVVVRVTYGDVTVLVGGDCEAEVCERSFDPGPVDVYKVHHHGSSDSSSAPLLEQMSPSIALISVGLGNDYGHPDASTLRSLDDLGVEVWRTDESGNVVVRTDGTDLSVEGDR